MPVRMVDNTNASILQFSHLVSENATTIRKEILSLLTVQPGSTMSGHGLGRAVKVTTGGLTGFYVIVDTGRRVRGTGEDTLIVVPINNDFGKSAGRVPKNGALAITPTDWVNLEIHLDRMGFRREAALYYFLIGNF